MPLSSSSSSLLLFLSFVTCQLHLSNANTITRTRKQNNHISSAHVVVSKEGPPPSPQEYTISKLEKAVVCAARGDKTWAKWKDYDLDGVCSRLQYYGEIEEPCGGLDVSGYYRQCVGRYKCTQTSYNYWVNLKWWQFLIWEVVIVILGCCFFGLACGCCIRCYYGRNGNRSVNPVRGVVNAVRNPPPSQQRRQGRNGNQV